MASAGVDNGMSCAPVAFPSPSRRLPVALQRRLRVAYHQAYHHRQRVLPPPRLLGSECCIRVLQRQMVRLVRRRRSRSAPPLAPSSAPALIRSLCWLRHAHQMTPPLASEARDWDRLGRQRTRSAIGRQTRKIMCAGAARQAGITIT
jgi:hypothetical protein